MHKKDILAVAWDFVSKDEYTPRQARSLNGRAIRAVCAAQPQHFLSSQRGYKLAKYATEAELAEAEADLRSRAKCLLERADAISKVLYDRGQSQLALEDQRL